MLDSDGKRQRDTKNDNIFEKSRGFIMALLSGEVQYSERSRVKRSSGCHHSNHCYCLTLLTPDGRITLTYPKPHTWEF